MGDTKAGAGDGAGVRPWPVDALVETKLRRPWIPPRLIRRPAIAALLDDLADRPLTLLVAPAGYGKTTALAMWAEDRPDVGWVSLEPDDDDPVRFAAYVLAALGRASPDLGVGELAGLTSPVVDLETVADRLVNELESAPERVTLVLDDFHVIRSARSLDFVERLVTRAPRGLRLVIATRSDPRLPLGRLRATRSVGELRTDRLRFAPDESAAFLNDALSLGLSERALALFDERTEGWPAGLYLAALSLEGADDADTFARRFAGSHRAIVDYLGEQVLAGLPADTRAFLLATAVVERFTPELCEVLTGQPGARARLAELERDNLFVVALDDEGRWYRYHRLFQQVLRAELDRRAPGEVRTLQLRAAEWARGAGLVELAARSAIAADDMLLAATILAEGWRALARSGDLSALWPLLAALPNERLGAARGAVEAVRALAAGLEGRPEADVARHLALAREAGFGEIRPVHMPTLDAADLFLHAAFLFDDVRVQERAALGLIERYGHEPHLAPLGRATLGVSRYFDGRPEEARRTLEPFGLEVQPGLLVMSLFVVSVRALVEIEAGHLDLGRALAGSARDTVAGHPLAAIGVGGMAHAAIGASLAADGRWEEAIGPLERSLALRGAFPGIHRAHALLALAPVRDALGERRAALAAVAEARTVIAACPGPGGLPARLAAVEADLVVRGRGTSEAGVPSAAEMRVLRLLPSRLSAREIAAELFLTHETVRTHTRALYRKLGATDRADAVARARARGLL